MESLMDKELYRISSFRSWPHTGISSVLLARSGFYYTGPGDKIVCHSCKAEIDRCTSNDDVANRHKILSPCCQYVNGNKENTSSSTGLGNSRVANTLTPGQPQAEGIGSQRPKGSYNTESLMAAGANVECTPDTSRPDYAKLRDEEERLKTFWNWPESAHADPQELAREGLFYTGSIDRVRCAFCCGRIRSWEPGDVPSAEHEKHFPECPFVRGLDVGNIPIRKLQRVSAEARSKQDNTVSNVHRVDTLVPQSISTTSRELVREQANPRTVIPPTTFPSTSTGLVSYRIDPREIKARMDTAMVRAILGMGYEKELVRKAIEIRLKTKGDDFPNAGSLLEQIFALQEEQPTAHAADAFYLPEPSTAAGSSEIGTAGVIGISQTTQTVAASSSPGSSTDTLHLSDSHALPPLQTLSLSTSTSMAQVPLTLPTSGDVTTAGVPGGIAPNGPESAAAETQPKSKGKRKKNKKKKTTATTNGQEQKETPGTVDPEQLTEQGGLKHEEALHKDNEYVEENRRLRDARTCKVCMDAEVTTVFLPCGHLVCCDECSPAMRNCPICRTAIRGTVKTFLS